jgi:hypothetical protein
MSKCKDPELGSLLLAYELGGLAEVENERFETHLIECEYCFDELQSFQSEASLLSNDEEVRQLVGQSAHEVSTKSRPLLKRLWQYLWPDRPVIFRPALAYFLVLLMIIPAYRGLMDSSENMIRTVQTVNLLPDRSIDEGVFIIGMGSDGLLSFVLRRALPGHVYTITIESSAGETIFRDENFSNFDEYETGRLILPLTQVDPGDYRLIIIDPSSAPPANKQEYIFRIKE